MQCESLQPVSSQRLLKYVWERVATSPLRSRNTYFIFFSIIYQHLTAVLPTQRANNKSLCFPLKIDESHDFGREIRTLNVVLAGFPGAVVWWQIENTVAAVKYHLPYVKVRQNEVVKFGESACPLLSCNHRTRPPAPSEDEKSRLKVK